MRKIFIIGGIVLIGWVIALSGYGLWLIESHKKTLNRLKTQKGRQTRLDNLENKDNPSQEINDNGKGDQVDKEFEEIIS